MKPSKRKRQKRVLIRSFFLLTGISFLILIGYFYTWAPFIRIQAPADQVRGIRTFLRSVAGQSLLSGNKLISLDWRQIKAPLTNPILVRPLPFFWQLHFSEKYQARYIYLNQYIREVDFKGKLLSAQEKESIQANSLMFYYPVEIQSEKTDIDEAYQTEVAPLIAYLYHSDSGLGPKIRHIQYQPSTGLTLTVFQKTCLVGFIGDNPEGFIQDIEKKILRLEEYIETKSSWDEYVLFDLRFSNQIICRKHQ